MATVLNPPEQRIVLRNVSWETYERLLADHMDSSSPRFTYDRGALEIMSPSSEHEELNRAIARIVEIIIEEMDIDARTILARQLSSVKTWSAGSSLIPVSTFRMLNSSKAKTG